MSSSDNGKKRKVNVEDGEGIGGGDGAVASMPTQDVMAEMKAMLEQNNWQLNHMRKEMEAMNGRHATEVEAIKSQLKQTEARCQYFDDRCSSLERSVKVLAKDVKWEYSAPDIPDSHWIEQGHDERYVEGMNWFLEQLREITCKMRRGESNDIILGDEDEDDDTRYPVVLHDDLLMPHWKELTDAIQLDDGLDEGGLNISNIQLHPNVFEILVESLKSRKLKGFLLKRNDFANTREGINFAIQVAKDSPSMKTFGWVNNPVNSMKDVNNLLENIASCRPSLENISLENICGEGVNGYDILCTLLECNGNLKYINLNKNNIHTKGEMQLPDFLATNPPLQRLLLRNNELDDNDAALIASSLKQNTNLNHLWLEGNKITYVGRGAILGAIRDLSSLDALAASNHTCVLWGLDLGGGPTNDYMNSPNENRGKKIYSLLSDRNKDASNVHYLDLEFGDDSVKYVPRVLECVGKYARYRAYREDVRSFSIMYEMLRSWNMPEMYQMR